MSNTLTVRLPDDLASRLDAAVKTSRRPKSSYVIDGLAQALDRAEWEQKILKAANDYQTGRLETYPADEVRTYLCLDD